MDNDFNGVIWSATARLRLNDIVSKVSQIRSDYALWNEMREADHNIEQDFNRLQCLLGIMLRYLCPRHLSWAAAYQARVDAARYQVAETKPRIVIEVVVLVTLG